MTRRLKRVDPYWMKSAFVPALAVGSGAAALLGAQSGHAAVAVAGASACAVAGALLTKPALSAVFAVFGLLGGVVTLIAAPSPGLSPLMRVTAAAGFSVFYMVLMDIVVLVISAVYNGFTRAGLRGFALEFEKSDVTVS